VQALCGITVIRADNQPRIAARRFSKVSSTSRAAFTTSIMCWGDRCHHHRHRHHHHNHYHHQESQFDHFNLSAPVSATLRSNYDITLPVPWNTFLFGMSTVVIISINWQ
jgi:hypothetical protein